MDLDEKIRTRLDELIDMGDRVLGTRRNYAGIIPRDAHVNGQMAHQWATSVQNILSSVFGKDSEHYRNFAKQIEQRLTFSPASRAQGVLKAAKDDYENGQLFEVRRLVEAELFGSFLDQAVHLHSSGYYQAAAVVVGCVLEDGLRKLCKRKGFSLSDKVKLDKMNADLAKSGVYSKLVNKKITALADLRNNAAHGKWDNFGSDDVNEMIRSVRAIMEEHFS